MTGAEQAVGSSHADGIIQESSLGIEAQPLIAAQVRTGMGGDP
jgi:hypothetical protein